MEARIRSRLVGRTSHRDSLQVVAAEMGMFPDRISEVHAQNLRADPACRGEGDFTMQGRSVSGLLLERIGILPPQKSRWNPDGSWNY
jgi:hypothetical protein